MNRSVGSVGCYILLRMSKTLRMILQQNVRKQQMVQHSLMNDESPKDFGVLAVSEPYSRAIENTVVTFPIGHANWTKMVPSVQRQERWVFRSMLWIRKDIEAEQVRVQSADLTAAVLRLPDRSVLVVLVDVEGQNGEALVESISKLDQLICDTRDRVGTRVDVLLAGDFNRHDQLWGGNDVSASRQGEADPSAEGWSAGHHWYLPHSGGSRGRNRGKHTNGARDEVMGRPPHTLPRTNPLSRLRTTVCRRFTSPLQKVGQSHEDVPVVDVETIQGYAISPWEQRLPAIIDPDCKKAGEAARHTRVFALPQALL